MAVKVEVENGNVDKALNKLKRKLKDSNHWVEWKKHQRYTKPSKERRDARHKAKMRERSRAKREFAWDKNSKYYHKKQGN